MAQKVPAEVAVAATSCSLIVRLGVVFLALASQSLFAAILPEDRADVMYHRYDGGGMVIDGPSYLVRKSIGNNVSVSANYYVDKVSSASIDVQTIKGGASSYSEERTEKSGDITYLVDKTTINVGHTTSEENDYEAKNYRLDLSRAFFSEMTTISAGFSLGDDDISRSDDEDAAVRFNDSLERRNYRFGVSQILSKNLLLNVNYESVIDEGFLQNPYRQIIELDCAPDTANPSSCSASLQSENYPRTRNSDAFSVKLSWHLPWSAALKTKASYFSDSWGIDGASVSVDYTHRLSPNLIADFRARAYAQGDAKFYANEFFTSNSTSEDFRGRDKELSEHSSFSIGLGASYRHEMDRFFTSAELNAQIDYFFFDYDNFSEIPFTPATAQQVLSAPAYSFEAYALRVFATLRY